MLDRSVASYKKLKSFSMQGEEKFKEGDKLRYASFLLAVQWPWRAKLKLYSKTGAGPIDGLRLETSRLLDASKYIEWNAGEKEPRAIAIKSVAARQDALTKIFRSDSLLVLGVLPLASGKNPARASGVRQVLFSREKGMDGPVLKVRVVRFDAEDKRLLTLDYFCSEKTGFLERFASSWMVDKKAYTASFDFAPTSGADYGDQESNDRYVYSWERLPTDADRGERKEQTPKTER